MNYMKQVAEMFGVELGEEFEIKFKSPSACKATAVFTEDKFRIINIDAYITIPYWEYAILHSLLIGDCTIERKPWKPKNKEKYYSVIDDGAIDESIWFNDCFDIIFYKFGNCYSTREEAEANRDKWAAFYASDEILEVRA